MGVMTKEENMLYKHKVMFHPEASGVGTQVSARRLESEAELMLTLSLVTL